MLFELGWLSFALLLCKSTTLVESATLWQLEQAWHNSLNRWESLPFAGRVGSRKRVQQGTRVWVLGGVEKVGHRSNLHNLSGIHHDDPIANLSDHTKVVRDQNDGRIDLLLQVLHQAKNLCLNGDVQRRGGLIRDQNFRFAGQGHGDDDSLPHPA